MNRVLRAQDLNLARGSNKWRLPAGHKDASLRARLPAAEMPSSETGILQPERLPRGLPGALQDFGLRFLDFFVRRLLDAGYVVSRIFGRQNQFVELQLWSQRIAALRRLDQKDHQERDDRRACVDDELPGVAEAEQRAGGRPNKYDGHGQEEGCWSAGNPRGRDSQASEPIALRLRRCRRIRYREVCAHGKVILGNEGVDFGPTRSLGAVGDTCAQEAAAVIPLSAQACSSPFRNRGGRQRHRDCDHQGIGNIRLFQGDLHVINRASRTLVPTRVLDSPGREGDNC